MSKVFFKFPCLDGYYYDRATDEVFSTKRPGPPHSLTKTWTRGTWRVTLSNVSYTKQEVLSMLDTTISAVVPDNSPTSDLSHIKPTQDYVMFSVRNQCSQYFFGGTSIADALAKFEKRGEVIDPDDIRILNTVTHAVSRLTVKTVKTYALT